MLLMLVAQILIAVAEMTVAHHLVETVARHSVRVAVTQNLAKAVLVAIRMTVTQNLTKAVLRAVLVEAFVAVRGCRLSYMTVCGRPAEVPHANCAKQLHKPTEQLCRCSQR